MRHNNWNKDLIAVLISTLVTVVVWAGLEVYRAYIRVDMPEGVERHLVGIDASLETEIFDKLEDRMP